MQSLGPVHTVRARQPHFARGINERQTQRACPSYCTPRPPARCLIWHKHSVCTLARRGMAWAGRRRRRAAAPPLPCPPHPCRWTTTTTTTTTTPAAGRLLPQIRSSLSDACRPSRCFSRQAEPTEQRALEEIKDGAIKHGSRTLATPGSGSASLWLGATTPSAPPRLHSPSLAHRQADGRATPLAGSAVSSLLVYYAGTPVLVARLCPSVCGDAKDVVVISVRPVLRLQRPRHHSRKVNPLAPPRLHACLPLTLCISPMPLTCWASRAISAHRGSSRMV